MHALYAFTYCNAIERRLFELVEDDISKSVIAVGEILNTKWTVDFVCLS